MMTEFNQKLQELRKQKGLTQEELATALYVSRTAVSKWESGRGYPNIDSLKAIANFFGITVDALLSGEELITAAKEDQKQRERLFCDRLFALLDLFASLLLFLPFFREQIDGEIRAVSLLSLAEIAPYLRVCYFALVFGMLLFGILTLALQGCNQRLWVRNKNWISLTLSTFGVLLFTVGLQPYASTLLFVFLLIKALMLIKWH